VITDSCQVTVFDFWGVISHSPLGVVSQLAVVIFSMVVCVVVLLIFISQAHVPGFVDGDWKGWSSQEADVHGVVLLCTRHPCVFGSASFAAHSSRRCDTFEISAGWMGLSRWLGEDACWFATSTHSVQ